MRPRRGWWMLWYLPALAVAIVLQVVFRHAQSFLEFTSPFAVAIVGGAVLGYRFRHGFWVWDRKRRTIERWSWLVADSSEAPRRE